MDLNFWLKMPFYSLIGKYEFLALNNDDFLQPSSLIISSDWFQMFYGKVDYFLPNEFLLCENVQKIGSLLFNLPLSKLMSALNTFKLQSPLCLSPCHSYFPF